MLPRVMRTTPTTAMTPSSAKRVCLQGKAISKGKQLMRCSVCQLAPYCRDQAHHQGERNYEVAGPIAACVLPFANASQGRTIPSGRKKTKMVDRSWKLDWAVNTSRSR